MSPLEGRLRRDRRCREATAQAKLRKTLYWLCGNDFYLHEGPLVIEHAPGTEFPTAEIDHLAVTPFWRLHFGDEEPVRPNCPFDRRRLPDAHQRGRHAEARRSPIHQNRSKVRLLRAQLPPMWPVVGAGLFASADAVLDAQFPSTSSRSMTWPSGFAPSETSLLATSL